MQEFKKDGPGLFKQAEPVKIKGPDLKLPDVHDAARLAGLKDLELEDQEGEQEGDEQEGEETEEQKQEKAQARAERRRRRRLICCCGSRGCGIGPMTNVVEEDEDG